MRFQTTETVQTPDSETVLRVLETTLPEISSDVVRDGHQITLRGLGPSPRVRNPRDITILHVSSDQATTIIRADVTFQASALLGTTSQDSVVRSKLDYVFDQVRTRLSLDARRASHSDLDPHRVVELPARPPAKHASQEHTGKDPREPVDRPARVAERSAKPPVITVSTQSKPGGLEPVAESAPVMRDLPVAVNPIERLPVVEIASPAPVSRARAVIDSTAQAAKPRAERPMLHFSSSRPVQTTLVPALIVAIIALLLLFAIAAYYLLRPNPPEPVPTSAPAVAQPANQSSVSPVSPTGAAFRPIALPGESITLL